MSCKSIACSHPLQLMPCCCTATSAARQHLPACSYFDLHLSARLPKFVTGCLTQSGVTLVLHKWPHMVAAMVLPALADSSGIWPVWHLHSLRLTPCDAPALQITINMPLTDKTRGMFNKEVFAKMKVGDDGASKYKAWQHL